MGRRGLQQHSRDARRHEGREGARQDRAQAQLGDLARTDLGILVDRQVGGVAGGLGGTGLVGAGVEVDRAGLVQAGDVYEAGHPIVKKYPERFEPLKVHRAGKPPAVEQATAAPGEKRNR